jgi:flagellar hook-length control protein FliK
MNTRDGDSSFDQLLQAVTPDRSTDQSSSRMSEASTARSTDESSTRLSKSDTDAVRQADDRRETRDDIRQERETAAEAKTVDRKSSEANKSDDKAVNDKAVDEALSVKDDAEASSADDAVQEAIAGAMAAQAAMAAKPVAQPEMVEKTTATTEVVAPVITAPVAEQQQTPVIQLPDTDPQPLPDELKQAVQQTKAEAKTFQTAVNTASQELENQPQATTAPATQAASSTPAVSAPTLQNLSAQEPAVKVVQITAQPEDMVEVDATKALTSVYGSAAAKTENLVESKTLPMIQKISSEIVELAREQGKSMKIQIQPENMGKIDLRLITNSDGMRIVMTTEVPATGKLLETHMDQLQRQLADAGVSISGMSVNSQNAQGQSANASQNQSFGSGRSASPVFLQESEVVPTTTSRVSVSGLDYRI